MGQCWSGGNKQEQDGPRKWEKGAWGNSREQVR